MGQLSSYSLLPLFPEAKRIGEGKWLARCFVHEDDRPSLRITRTKEHGWLYRCFVCGARGDAIDVLVVRDEMTYAAARASLESEQGPPVRLYREPWKWLATCDSCLVETVEIRDVGHLVELGNKGDESWEFASDGTACVGPVCLRLKGFQ